MQRPKMISVFVYSNREQSKTVGECKDGIGVHCILHECLLTVDMPKGNSSPEMISC